MQLINQRNISHTLNRDFAFVRDGGPSNNQTSVQGTNLITGVSISPNKRYRLESIVHQTEILTVSNDSVTIVNICPAFQLFLSSSKRYNSNLNYPVNTFTGFATNEILISDVIVPLSASVGGEAIIGGVPTSNIPLKNVFGSNTIGFVPFYSRINIVSSIALNTDPIQSNDIIFDSYSYSYLMFASSFVAINTVINSPNSFGYQCISTMKMILNEYSL